MRFPSNQVKFANFVFQLICYNCVLCLGLENPGLAEESKVDDFSITSGEAIAQVPEVLPNSNQPNEAPFLETEPSKPEEKPFLPQNLPLLPSQTLVTPRRYKISPSITIITPSGYGKSWGNMSVGLGLQNRARFTNQPDGILGLSFGLGNSKKAIGVDVGVTVTDLDSFADGTLSLKVHRLLPNDFAVAVGVQNAIIWGNTDGGRSFYGVVTKKFTLQNEVQKPFSQLYVSAGIGSGQFRFESDVYQANNSVNAFGGVALRLFEPVNLIAEWSGQDLTVGLSIIPFRQIPLVITPAVSDITGNAGDGSKFILGIGYSITF